MENFKKVLSYLKENYFLIICSLPLLVWILSSLSIASVKKIEQMQFQTVKASVSPSNQSTYQMIIAKPVGATLMTLS